jgi:predicted phosphohydrolase
MKIFAIADTHLSGKPPAKPMDIFGDHWRDHWTKIKADWLARVAPEDTVLIAGDISWAMKLSNALEDLEEIAALPGKKILIRGNHDYWWQTVSKMTAAVGGRLTFLHNSFDVVGGWAVCGSRGWLTPTDPAFTPDDLPIYQRELGRTRASLEAARAAGHERLILMLHYPPRTGDAASGFTDLLAEFSVAVCVFGHLHNEAAYNLPAGEINGTCCYLVSCDALDFKLKEIVST